MKEGNNQITIVSIFLTLVDTTNNWHKMFILKKLIKNFEYRHQNKLTFIIILEPE